jgi:hypothetical protein
VPSRRPRQASSRGTGLPEQVVDFAATWADNLDDAIEDVAYMAALDEVQARSPGVAAQPGQTEALDAGSRTYLVKEVCRLGAAAEAAGDASSRCRLFDAGSARGNIRRESRYQKERR